MIILRFKIEVYLVLDFFFISFVYHYLNYLYFKLLLKLKYMNNQIFVKIKECKNENMLRTIFVSIFGV